MAPPSNKRKPELAWMSLAFCMMVLFSHCAGHPITHLRTDSWQFALLLLLQRLTYVSVYGFFVISGVKFMLPRSKPLEWGAYFKSRAKGLLLPYLIANVVYYAFYCWGVHYYTFDWGKFLDYLLHGNLVSPFYYLIVMFQFTLLAPAFQWTARHIPAKIALPAALIISWGSELYLARLIAWVIPGFQYQWSDRTFTTYLVYYLAGCYIGMHYDRFTTALKRAWLPVSAAFILLAGTDLYLLYRLRVKGIWSQWVPYAHLAYLLAAIAFCFCVALWLDRPLPRLLARVEKASFLIYLYHSILISALEWLSFKLNITDVGVLFCIRVPLIYIGTPVLCILWQDGMKMLKNKQNKPEVQ